MTIVHCPQCGDQVCVPPGADPDARVRCPLCSSQYALSEALAKLPPMLIIVDAPVAVSSQISYEQPGTNWLSGSAVSTGNELPFDEAPAEEFNFDVGEVVIGDAALATDDDTVKLPASWAASADTVVEEPLPGDLDDDGLPGLVDDAIGAPAFAFGDAATAGEAPTPGKRSAARPRKGARKQKSPVGEIIKVVLGGVIGLFLAIEILFWLPGGFARDPFNLGPKLPSFLVPAQFRGGSGGSSDTGDGNSLALNNTPGTGRDTTGGVLPDRPNDPNTTRPNGGMGNRPNTGMGSRPGGGPGTSGGIDMTPDGGLPFGTDDPGSGTGGPSMLPEFPGSSGGDPLGGNPSTGGTSPPSDPLGTPDISIDLNPTHPTIPPAADPTTPTIDPPSIDPPTVEPPSIDPPSIDPPTIPSPIDPEPPVTPPGIDPPSIEPPSVDPPSVDPPTVEPPLDPTPPVTPEPPVTPDPPTTDPPSTDPPTVEPPMVEPPDAPRIGGGPQIKPVDLIGRITGADVGMQNLADVDAGDRNALRTAAIDFYTQFSQLGEALVYVPKTQPPQVKEIRELLEKCAADPTRVGIIGGAGASWLSAPQRPSSGALLAGTVKKVTESGDLVEVQLDLTSSRPTTVTLLADKSLAASFPENEKVLVLGAIVDDPAAKVAGYEGGAASAVWAGMAVPVPAP